VESATAAETRGPVGLVGWPAAGLRGGSDGRQSGRECAQENSRAERPKAARGRAAPRVARPRVDVKAAGFIADRPT